MPDESGGKERPSLDQMRDAIENMTPGEKRAMIDAKLPPGMRTGSRVSIKEPSQGTNETLEERLAPYKEQAGAEIAAAKATGNTEVEDFWSGVETGLEGDEQPVDALPKPDPNHPDVIAFNKGLAEGLKEKP